MPRPSRLLHPDEVVGDFVRLFPDDVAVPNSSYVDVTARRPRRKPADACARFALVDSAYPHRHTGSDRRFDPCAVDGGTGVPAGWKLLDRDGCRRARLLLACDCVQYDLRIVPTDVTTLPPLALPFRSYGRTSGLGSTAPCLSSIGTVRPRITCSQPAPRSWRTGRHRYRVVARRLELTGRA